MLAISITQYLQSIVQIFQLRPVTHVIFFILSFFESLHHIICFNFVQPILLEFFIVINDLFPLINLFITSIFNSIIESKSPIFILTD